MAIIGIDIGTTNTKVGWYRENGEPVAIASRPTVAHHAAEGYSYYEPEEMWGAIVAALTEVAAKAGDEEVHSIGIASMAESGLLVDRRTGEARSAFLPWFDTCSAAQAGMIADSSDPYERFCKTGLHNSYKHGLAKLLWLQERDRGALSGSVWLSAAGYIAYRLTGRMAVDDSLAARTYAYNIFDRRWEPDWLRPFGLSTSLFPDVLPAGEPLGPLQPHIADRVGLSGSLQVAISGHDHVAAALSVGAIVLGRVYNSMGTAETLIGTIEDLRPGRTEYEAGLSFGVHAARGKWFWMGGNSSSGGSVEWFRDLLGEPKLEYAQLLQWLAAANGAAPTGMLYYPYLSGQGRGTQGAAMKAALIGFTKSHHKGDMIKAVLEGTAYELQSLRLAAEAASGAPIRSLTVVGGGTRNPQWLQIKSDVLGLPLSLPSVEEASLLGAALCAAIGAGVFDSPDAAAAAVTGDAARAIEPDMALHAEYQRIYRSGYIPLQAALRGYYTNG